MHVLVAAHDFFPDPGSGGTGRYVAETAKQFVDRGHRVSVVTRRRGDVPRRERVDGVDVFRYDLEIAERSAPEILRQLPAAARSVSAAVYDVQRRDSVDLLSFQGPVSSALVDRAAPEHLPRVLTFHSPWPVEYDIKRRDGDEVSTPRRLLNVRARAALEQRVVRASDRAIVLSEFMGGELDRVYDDVPPTTVLPGGVDTERFSPDADAYDPMESGCGGPALLTVRRLSERMGHPLLLRSFARIADDHPGAHLFIAGDGPLRDSLETTAAELGLADRVTFLGYVSEDDLPAAYATADLFVLPTVELEGFGLATVEALASGTPAVGTDVGGTSSLLGGFADAESLPADPLVRSLTEDSFARRLDEWLSLSPTDLSDAGDAARRYAAMYSWDAVADAVLKRYRLTQSGSPPDAEMLTS